MKVIYNQKRKHTDFTFDHLNGNRQMIKFITIKYLSKIILICSYGIDLWGCIRKSNINVIHRCQSKTYRHIANAPWCVSNQTPHIDQE